MRNGVDRSRSLISTSSGRLKAWPTKPSLNELWGGGGAAVLPFVRDLCASLVECGGRCSCLGIASEDQLIMKKSAWLLHLISDKAPPAARDISDVALALDVVTLTTEKVDIIGA